MSRSLSCLKRNEVSAYAVFRGLVSSVLFLAVLALASAADAAEDGAARRPNTDELPPPVDVGGNDLVTQDGVALKATFFPGSKGKESVPIILLHSWKGNRKEFVTLAPVLWQAGHAVLVPDLRGHGESTTQYVGGGSVELSAAKFVVGDFAQMVQFDMETLKSFLIKKNNLGELNIEKLCVVGAEMGATVALNWALLDWSWPQYPGIKQGQHVKALVLLSPERRFKGISIEDALKNPLLNRFLSVYILLGGEDPKIAGQNERIHAMLSRLHPEPAEGQEAKDQTLFYKAFETKAQGAKLLDPRLNLAAEQRIEKFIQLRLVAKDYPWAETGKKPGKSK